MTKASSRTSGTVTAAELQRGRAVVDSRPSVLVRAAETDMSRRIYKVMLLSESDSERRRSFADVLIRPDCARIGILEFHTLDRMRAVGGRAAVEALAAASPSVFG